MPLAVKYRWEPLEFESPLNSQSSANALLSIHIIKCSLTRSNGEGYREVSEL